MDARIQGIKNCDRRCGEEALRDEATKQTERCGGDGNPPEALVRGTRRQGAGTVGHRDSRAFQRISPIFVIRSAFKYPRSASGTTTLPSRCW